MKVVRHQFNSRLNQDEVDNIVNAMLVNLSEFSDMACLDGRMFGVKTNCDSCDYELNRCLRNDAVQRLAAAQIRAEEILGYPLTSRYVTEEITWTGEARIKTKYPGIEAVNVGPLASTVPGSPFTVSPYLQEDLTVVDSGFGYCIATLDSSLFPNPNQAIIRNADTLQKYSTQKVSGFPRRDDDGNWEVALDSPPQAPACAEELNAQHCSLMMIEVSASVECAGEIVPMYVGTNQVIPQAKAPEIAGDNLRFFFHPWVLLDEAFADEGADLERAEFYKLVSRIQLKCVRSDDCLPSITFSKWENNQTVYETTDEDVRVSIYNARDGILSVEYGNCSVCGCHLVNSCRCNRTPIRLNICYKANPAYLGFDVDYYTAKEAIAFLVAAELTYSACGCDPKTLTQGFLFEARQPYAKVGVNPHTGDTYVNLTYGKLHGQLVFIQKINTMKHASFSFIA